MEERKPLIPVKELAKRYALFIIACLFRRWELPSVR